MQTNKKLSTNFLNYFPGFFLKQIDFYLNTSSENRKLKFAKIVPSFYFNFEGIRDFLAELFADYLLTVSNQMQSPNFLDFNMKYNSYLLFDLSGHSKLGPIKLPALRASVEDLRSEETLVCWSSKFALYSYQIFAGVRHSFKVMNFLFSRKIVLMDTTNLIENENALLSRERQPRHPIGIVISQLPINDSIGKFSFGLLISKESIARVLESRRSLPPAPAPKSLVFEDSGFERDPGDFWKIRSVLIVSDDCTYASGLYVFDGHVVTVEHAINVDRKIKVHFYLGEARATQLNLKKVLCYVVSYQASVVYKDPHFDLAVLKLDPNLVQIQKKKSPYQGLKATRKSKYLSRVRYFLRMLDSEALLNKNFFLGDSTAKNIRIFGFPEFKTKDFNQSCVSNGSVMKTIKIKGNRGTGAKDIKSFYLVSGNIFNGMSGGFAVEAGTGFLKGVVISNLNHFEEGPVNYVNLLIAKEVYRPLLASIFDLDFGPKFAMKDFSGPGVKVIGDIQNYYSDYQTELI